MPNLCSVRRHRCPVVSFTAVWRFSNLEFHPLLQNFSPNSEFQIFFNDSNRILTPWKAAFLWWLSILRGTPWNGTLASHILTFQICYLKFRQILMNTTQTTQNRKKRKYGFIVQGQYLFAISLQNFMKLAWVLGNINLNSSKLSGKVLFSSLCYIWLISRSNVEFGKIKKPSKLKFIQFSFDWCIFSCPSDPIWKRSQKYCNGKTRRAT
jgi:hypothetical protein